MTDKKIIIAVILFVTILATAKVIFDYKFGYLTAIGIYLVCYFIVSFILSSNQEKSTESNSAIEWPTSGPIGK